MQIVLFLCFLIAEIAASAGLFRIAPLSPVCTWYPNVWIYVAGHFIASFLVVAVIAIGWWAIGNMAYWESICRTRDRRRTLFRAGLAGLGIELLASLLLHTISTLDVMQQGSILLWLLLRAVLWAVAYAVAGGIVLWLLKLELRSRRIAT
jgi:hypothetical protein